MVVAYSTNRNYAVDSNNLSVLYIKNGVTDFNHTMIGRATKLPIVNDYIPYKYTPRKFVNDCLQFAESMAADIPGYNEERCIFRSKNSMKSFGESDDLNSKIALKDREDNEANPNIGEAYAIVSLKVNPENPDLNYHIGYVVAKDGDTNITLEADAGVKGQRFPVFDMYDDKKTFHKRYSEIYKPASTIVLKKL